MYSSAYIWGKVLNYLEQRLTEITVSAWFDDAEVVEFAENRLVIYSPTEFRRGMILSRTAEIIKEGVREMFDLDIELIVLGDEELDAYRNKAKNRGFNDFNPQFTFEKFVVGSSNRMAFSASMAIANGLTAGNNPLFIYGPPGIGKTHLLYAIASRVHEVEPDASIVYVKSMQFTNELIDAIKKGTTSAFREKYNKADILLVDDIQFIGGKESTQEEYFHTFNVLYESGKRIVMTSDFHPRKLPKLEERLRTRFEWGLTVDITPPDYETRVAILRNRAAAAGIDLPDEIGHFIAENVTTDVRRLESAINTLKATLALEHKPLDLPFAMRVLKNLKPDENAVPTPSLIIYEVCRFYSLEESSLRSNQRNKVVSEARQVAMYLMQSMIGLSTTDIGKELARDHATVLYGIERIKIALEKTSSGIADNLRDIVSNINGKL